MPRHDSPGPFTANSLVATAFVLLLAACTWLTWPALSGPFLFDDFPNLGHLALLGGSQMDWHSLANYMAQYGTSPGRPLSMLSFVINDFGWPSDPRGFKYTNLMLHLLVGVIVFGLARALARLRVDATRANLAALLAMGAWLLHPMQLSTSMLVVQRMTQLSALFVFSGLWAYVALADRAHTIPRALLALAALGACTLLATLCKETGALSPLLAMVANWTLLRDRMRSHPVAPRSVLLAGTGLPVLALLAKIIHDWSGLTDYGYRNFTLGERLLTQGRVLVQYLYEIMAPNLRGNGIYHDDFAVSHGWLDPWTTLPAMALVTLLVSAAVALHRRAPVFSFAALWFFAGHLLESSVFPLEIYFEHRNYLPMFGPLFFASLHVAKVTGSRKRVARAAAIGWIAFAGLLTWIQAPIWGSADKLTKVWLVEQPMSARVLQQRAQYLFNGRRPIAAAELMLDGYDRGVRGEDFPLQAFNVACTTHDEEIAGKALPMAMGALRSGHYNRAVLQTLSKLRMNVQARTCPEIIGRDLFLGLTTVLLSNPHYAKSGLHSFIHVERAYMFEDRRNLNATMRELEAAWESSPTPQLARYISVTLASAGLYDDASMWADRAAALPSGGVLGWLTDDDTQSIRLQQALRKVIAERAGEGEDAGE